MSFECSICKKVCKSKGGLTKHYNICKLKKETEQKVKEEEIQIENKEVIKEEIQIENKIINEEKLEVENKEVIKGVEKEIKPYVKRWWEEEDDDEENISSFNNLEINNKINNSDNSESDDSEDYNNYTTTYNSSDLSNDINNEVYRILKSTQDSIEHLNKLHGLNINLLEGFNN